MNTEHTAENWTAFQNPEDEGSNYWRIRMQDGLKDSLHGYCGEKRARLIAAAPDLLEALKMARLAIGEHYAPHDCYATGPLTGDHYLDLVACPACAFIKLHDAAIAKAEGKS